MQSINELTIQKYLSAIDDELQKALVQAKDVKSTQLYDMLAYHMGWNDDRLKSDVRGKRIRPLLVLLTCAAAGGDWKDALPVAAAVEMVHNFSLIHDDIEDHSALRRGRLTVWKKWGIPQAINAGDAMFTLAHLHAIKLSDTVSQSAAIKAAEILQQACLHLTQGQYLDLAFEKRQDVTIEEYWSMVEGKTAALISASAELGAVSAQCNEVTCSLYRQFGRLYGLAFQAQDDLLGIWGDLALTGKSNQSDLITNKKTLPILHGLTTGGKFAERWKLGSITPSETYDIALLLEDEGGKKYTSEIVTDLVEKAHQVLDQAKPLNESGVLLKDLTMNLVHSFS